VLVALATAACGRIGFEPIEESDLHFGSPVYVEELNRSSRDDDPSLTGDLLEIYFASTRGGGMGGSDIWSATRSSPTASWNPPQPVVELNSTGDEDAPEVTRDGLTLYLASTRGGNDDIYVATRLNRADLWSLPIVVPELSSSTIDESAAESASRLTIYLHSDRAGNQNVYTSSRAATTDPWQPPQLVAELATSVFDGDPFDTDAGRMLLLSSQRSGGMGDEDLWVALRADTAVPFDPPEPIAELNSDVDDGGPWLSDDLHVVFFHSARAGNRDIYMATR
jgi:hypothetical protein